jgi:hypothetical protein
MLLGILRTIIWIIIHLDCEVCEIQSSHSDKYEDYNRLGCDTVCSLIVSQNNITTESLK